MATLEKELVVKRGGAVSAAATNGTDLESAAKPLIEQFSASLTRHTEAYVRYVEELKNGQKGASLAEPNVPVAGLPVYSWWNVVMAGPFQLTGVSPTGPFLPNKIIRASESAFMLGAIWRNPAGIGWNNFNPSAVTMMASLNLSVQFQTLNLTTGMAGPIFSPVGPIPSPLGFTNPIIFAAPLAFPAPPQGTPHLYEINLVADVNGPIPGIPFAGYSTWHVDPDVEPGFLFLPPVAPALQHDIPARILVYTA